MIEWLEIVERRRAVRPYPLATLEGRAMTLTLFSTIVLSGGLGIGSSAEFHPPTRLKADGVPVRVESPGYAAPCWADIDGDGKKDLLVGQFHGGKICVYKNLGEVKLAPAQWLKAEGAVAEVPGVW
jgi:hypothetical protein